MTTTLDGRRTPAHRAWAQTGDRWRELSWALGVGVAAGGATVAGLQAPLPVQIALVAAGLAAPPIIVALWGRERTDAASTPWDRVTVAVVLAVGAIATDVVVLGPRWSAYAIAALLLVLFLLRPRTGRALPPDIALALLLVWGLVGSLYGRLFLGQENNALAFFAPAVIGLVHLWAPLPLHHPLQARRLTVALLATATAYVLLSYVTLVQGLPVLPVEDFQHTRVYWISMVLTAAWVLRQRVLLVALGGVSVLTFAAYPALTSVLVLASAAVVVIAVVGRRVGPAALALGSLVVVLALSLTGTRLGRLRAEYFQEVGKTDNSSTREVFLDIGLDRLAQRPFVGDAFTADIAVPSTVTGPYRLVPLHNDYLQLAVSGGVLGGGLFLLWSVGVVLLGVRLARRLLAEGQRDAAALALVVTVGITGMLVTCWFNPILIDQRNSLLLGLLSTTLASLALAARRRGAWCASP